MTVAGPAGMRRDTQSSSLQIDAETALRAVGRAVAVSRLAVAYHLVAPHQSGEREIVTCDPINQKSQTGKTENETKLFFSFLFSFDGQTFVPARKKEKEKIALNL